ncbi:hypothetical protein DFQ26_004056, partial [Actinomortierella ambigua]
MFTFITLYSVLFGLLYYHDKAAVHSANDSEYIFASRESHLGGILIWEATSSTETNAQLKTMLEWPISESEK